MDVGVIKSRRRIYRQNVINIHLLRRVPNEQSGINVNIIIIIIIIIVICRR